MNWTGKESEKLVVLWVVLTVAAVSREQERDRGRKKKEGRGEQREKERAVEKRAFWVERKRADRSAEARGERRMIIPILHNTTLPNMVQTFIV